MSNAINAVSKRLNPNDFVHEPTFYHPRFCEMLSTHMAEGYSFESFASVILIGRSTLYTWRKQYVALYEAYERGISNYINYWERVAMDGFKDIPPSVWRWNMARVKTMYRDDMEEKVRLQVLKSQLMKEAKNEPLHITTDNTKEEKGELLKAPFGGLGVNSTTLPSTDYKSKEAAADTVENDETTILPAGVMPQEGVATNVASDTLNLIAKEIEELQDVDVKESKVETESTAIEVIEAAPKLVAPATTAVEPTPKRGMTAVEKFIKKKGKHHKGAQRGRSMYHR